MQLATDPSIAASASLSDSSSALLSPPATPAPNNQRHTEHTGVMIVGCWYPVLTARASLVAADQQLCLSYRYRHQRRLKRHLPQWLDPVLQVRLQLEVLECHPPKLDRYCTPGLPL
jgi:hypothetical protein